MMIEKGILGYEVKRYHQKGLSLLVAASIVVGFFYLVPAFLESIWPQALNLAGFQGDYKDKMFLFKMVFLFESVPHLGALLLGNGLMLIVYKIKSPFFEQYKINPERPWPWDHNYQEWREMLNKSLKQVIFNALFLHTGLMALDVFILDDILMTMDYSFPTLPTMLGQLVFFALFEDFTFYWSHRLLHHPRLYPSIHKQHHQYKDTISIASEYAHPLETFLSNILPTVYGYKLLKHKVHLITVAIWIFIRVMESVDGHCGYEFPFSPYRLLPFSSSSSFHNYHHSHNIGNYGSLFGYWDYLCNTDKTYKEFLNKKESVNAKRE